MARDLAKSKTPSATTRRALKIRLGSGEVINVRTIHRLLKKIGRPVSLTTREQANQITQRCLQNNSSVEDIHSQGKISQAEMKPTMIEASARVDYLLRTRRFFKKGANEVFDFAFRNAISNNCATPLTGVEWKDLEREVGGNLTGILSRYRSSPQLYMLFLLTNIFYGSAADWDTQTIFDGRRLMDRGA